MIGTSARELRALFNHDILPRVESGELTELVVESAPASPRSNQPPGTLSQSVEYYDGGELVAVAHRFLLPDGLLGASGLPDPKLIHFEGDWYKLDL